MAERRMFAKTIIDSDAFLDMPNSTQALYFHLGMRADDEGFINNARKIQRIVGASDDDIKLLVAKKFVIPFETGVIVIRHWKIHNYIRKDRLRETMHKEEKALLIEDENKAYSECLTSDGQVTDKCQHRLVEDRLVEDRLVEDSPATTLNKKDISLIIKEWNKLGLQELQAINSNTKRHTMLKARIKEYSLDEVIEAIRSIAKSDFLQGQNNRGWTITFDWLVRPNNFIKVLEGNYIDDKGGSHGKAAKQHQENDRGDEIAKRAGIMSF